MQKTHKQAMDEFDLHYKNILWFLCKAMTNAGSSGNRNLELFLVRENLKLELNLNKIRTRLIKEK